MDNTNELIIWDIRYMAPLQVIPAPNQKEKLSTGLLTINSGLLWVYGSRFVTYNEREVFDEKLGDNSEIVDVRIPINAFHNQFFGTICVQTAQDMKIYSCLDG